MELILVRHGDAHAGFTGPISGHQGCRGLTSVGQAQADLLRRRLEGWAPDAALTGRLPRSRQTLARILAPEWPAGEEECRLCELHVGEADGVDWADLDTRFGAFDMVAEPERPFAPGGESWNGFHTRVADVFDELAARHPDRSVLAVTSAGVIAASLRLFFGGPVTEGPRLTPRNTGLTIWRHDHHGWTLDRYDDAGHLPAVGFGRR